MRKELPAILLNFNKESVQSTHKNKSKFLKKNPILKKFLHLNFLVAQIADNAFLIKNYFLFTHFNFKSKISVNTYKQKLNKKNSETNAQIHYFLKSKFYKNKKTGLRKEQLAYKLYYNISISVLLRKIKKKKIKGAHSRVFRRKLKKFHKKLSSRLKLQSYTKYAHFLGKNKYRQNKHKEQIIKDIKKIN